MNSPARLLLWTDDPGRGGVAQYNHSLALALRAAGHAVCLVQTRADTPLIRAQAAAGITHRFLDYDTSADFARTLSDTDTARDIFAAEQPDAIVFSDGCPLSNLAARQEACAQSLPFVCVVGFVAPYLAERFPAALPVLARHYAAAAEVVAVSAENLAQLRRLYRLPAGKGRVIHYGRPPEFFSPPEPSVRARLRATLGLGPETCLILTPARLTKIKGHTYQLAALEALCAQSPATAPHAVWLGDGETRPALEAEIIRRGLTGRVHLLGHRWDAADWFDAADIFVLSTEHEGMPLSIMEAMAKGLPVAASAVSGIPEQLGSAGCLLPDPKSRALDCAILLARTLATWCADAALRHRVGQAGRERALRLFTEARMHRDTLALLDSRLLSATPLSACTLP